MNNLVEKNVNTWLSGQQHKCQMVSAFKSFNANNKTQTYRFNICSCPIYFDGRVFEFEHLFETSTLICTQYYESYDEEVDFWDGKEVLHEPTPSVVEIKY